MSGEIVILVAERHGGRFGARLANGRELVRSSRQPFLDAARVLLAESVDPDMRLVMMRGETRSLSAPIGKAARLTVKENDRHGPRFAPWRPMPDDERHRVGLTVDRTAEKTAAG